MARARSSKNSSADLGFEAKLWLKGVLPKDYARPGLDEHRPGELIDLIGTISFVAGVEAGVPTRTSETSAAEDSRRYSAEAAALHRSKDILGRVYEYFLGQFASAEGKKGGQFYTPQSVVRLLVEMLAPYKGRIYDPCCGSGGMFVQLEKFISGELRADRQPRRVDTYA